MPAVLFRFNQLCDALLNGFIPTHLGLSFLTDTVHKIEVNQCLIGDAGVMVKLLRKAWHFW